MVEFPIPVTANNINCVKSDRFIIIVEILCVAVESADGDIIWDIV
jgi:hypothetical protein